MDGHETASTRAWGRSREAVMNPEIAVLLQRAAGRRILLEGLLDSIPAAYWERQAPGDTWPAIDHLRHLATVDDLVLPIVQQAAGGRGSVWLGGRKPTDLGQKREAAMNRVAGMSITGLRSRVRSSREAVAVVVGRLPTSSLDCVVRAAASDDGWSAPPEWPLRAYLAGWAEHDTIHGEAIRRAITSPPDLAAVALVRRRL